MKTISPLRSHATRMNRESSDARRLARLSAFAVLAPLTLQLLFAQADDNGPDPTARTRESTQPMLLILPGPRPEVPRCPSCFCLTPQALVNGVMPQQTRLRRDDDPPVVFVDALGQLTVRLALDFEVDQQPFPGAVATTDFDQFVDVPFAGRGAPHDFINVPRSPISSDLSRSVGAGNCRKGSR